MDAVGSTCTSLRVPRSQQHRFFMQCSFFRLAEDVDDLESPGMRTGGGVGFRMRKVLPSPEDMNGASCGFQAEDIFVDYSSDEDADRDSEEVMSPRSR